MKNDLSFSIVFLLSLLFLLAHTSEGSAVPDIRHRQGCKAIHSLLHRASGACSNRLDHKKEICRCPKGSANNLGIQDKFLSQTPADCNINVRFPVSTTTNCETIH